ncbi:MAG TPA: VWA domain-containing protein, partial [Saprospiraceae bacterium]|nr:VWA domain-containing protein [Saprospiraceae bacterium]
MWNDFNIHDPWWLLLLGLIPLVTWYRERRKKEEPSIALEVPVALKEIPISWRMRLHHWIEPLFWLAMTLLIIALARPQTSHSEEIVKGEGIDIFLVMDLSSSMLARDFSPDRLSVSKRVATDFIKRRTYDRIGLVVFAGESYTQCPLTHDHDVLIDYLNSLECGQLEDGTAIGMGLAAAANRLKDSEAKSKVVVLLTDGVNNAGYIRPATAAGIAQQFGIKVYTIGIGSYGQALSPVRRGADGEYRFGLTNVEIDENLLKDIADQTGGRYYRAVSEASLQKIYDEIDQLEKTPVEITAYKRFNELYYIPLTAGLILLTLLIAARSTFLRTL